MMIGFQLLQTVGVYGWANWLPTFLVQQGIPLVTSLRYTLIMAVASPLGPLVAVWCSDRLEKKWTIVMLSAAMAVTGLVFLQVRAPWQVIACGATLTMLSYWFSAAFHAYQAELFPTRARATGVGFALQLESAERSRVVARHRRTARVRCWRRSGVDHGCMGWRGCDHRGVRSENQRRPARSRLTLSATRRSARVSARSPSGRGVEREAACHHRLDAADAAVLDLEELRDHHRLLSQHRFPCLTTSPLGSV